MILQLCLAVGLAVVISALCSVAEAALYSVPLTHIEILADSGRKSGRLLQKLRQDVSRPIAAILTLNTIANTMGAAVAGASAAAVFGDHNLAWFSAGFTMVILIFSEIIPKTAGVAYAKQLSPYIGLPLIILVKMFKPFIFLCQAITGLIQRKSDVQPLVTAQEIQAVTSLGHKSGEIDHHEVKAILNILDLKNKMVRKVMTPRTVTFSLNTNMTVGEAYTMKDRLQLHSRIPLYDRDPDDIVGIILRRDVLVAAAEGNTETKLTDLMKPAHFVPETAPLPKVLLEFFEHRQHLFIVVDEYGSVTGVISLEDIIEEIMGEEIMDESDKTRDMRALARFIRFSNKR